MKCQRCGTERVGTTFKVCQNCGFKFKDKGSTSDYSHKVFEHERKLKESKSNKNLFIIALIVFGGLYVLSKYGDIANDYQAQKQQDREPRDVRYQVTGTATHVSVTLRNNQGNTEQYSDRPVPYSYMLNASKGQFLYISAQNSSGYSGSVKTDIYVEGNLYQTSKSVGKHVIATASGSCP